MVKCFISKPFYLDADECATSPCQNGGTCVDLVGSYRCNCVDGWIGVNCEGKWLYYFVVIMSIAFANSTLHTL